MSDSPRLSSIEQLLERLPAVYFRERVDGSFEHLGGGVEQLFGLDPNELLADCSLLGAAVHERPGGPLDCEGELPAKNGGRIFQLWHARSGELKTIREFRMPIEAEGKVVGHEGLWLDHSGWELVEKRLEASSWKEILCRLTQGFTHDLNNALTGLMAMSELMVAQTDDKHPFHDAVNVVKQSTLKAADLVRRLNQLLQSAPGKGEFSDGGIILAETLELLHKTIPRRVRVQQDITSEPLPVRADGWALRLLLLHVVTNALEAMPENGTLYIQASRAEVAPTGAPAAGQLAKGPWVRLSISDTGPGLAAGSEAFEPWFGTKPSQMGTGLGLLVARRFCQQNSGAFFIVAKEGFGTTAELWLPEADLNAKDPLAAKGRRLFLAGNEPRQISEIALVCRTNGYAVVVSPDLRSVLRLLALNASEFDALLLMGAKPELKAAMDWLRRERLQIPTVLLTDETEVPEADLVISYSDPQSFLRRLKNVFP